MTFGAQNGGDESIEVIKVIEEINAGNHHEYELETYLEVFKKLEKFLGNELATNTGNQLSWYFESARDAMLKMFKETIKCDKAKNE